MGHDLQGPMWGPALSQEQHETCKGMEVGEGVLGGFLSKDPAPFFQSGVGSGKKGPIPEH